MAPQRHFDIFISYRRDGGEHIAQLVYIALTSRGYAVFMDVRDLRSGPFDSALLETITQASDLILILSPGSLDRCTDANDWVRRELSHSIGHGLNVIPVTTDGFQMPASDALPADIAGLPMLNCIKYSHEHCDDCIESLARMLRSKPRSELMRIAKVLAPHALWLSALAASRIQRPASTQDVRRQSQGRTEYDGISDVVSRWAASIKLYGSQSERPFSGFDPHKTEYLIRDIFRIIRPEFASISQDGIDEIVQSAVASSRAVVEHFGLTIAGAADSFQDRIAR